MIRKYFFLLLVLLLQNNLLNSQSLHANYDDQCKSIVTSLLKTDYFSADTSIENAKKNNPGNILPHYFKAYRYFIHAASKNSAKSLKLFQDEQQNFADKINHCTANFPEKNYCLAQMRLLSAFLNWKNEEFLPAALDIKKAYSILSSNKREFPDFIPNQTGLGLINFMAGSLPDDFQWITKIFGLRGHNNGVEDLWAVYNFGKENKQYEYAGIEAVFIISYINTLSQSNEDDIAKLLNTYLKEEPFQSCASCPLVVYLKSLMLLKNGLIEHAEKDLNAYINQNKNYPIPHMYYLSGMVNLYNLKPSTLIHFSRYLSEAGQGHYVNSSRQKLAWYSLLNSDTAAYNFHINKISESNKIETDEDKLALKEAQSKVMPNIVLLKSRIYFDGGNYNKSLHTLINQSPSDFIVTKKDGLEYTYRLGRIYQEKQMFEKSNDYFLLTLEQGKLQPYYYAANSALMLAYHYEKAGNFEKAKEFYEMCLSLDYDEYRNSISHKARTGLKRVKK